jgi:DNA polymerase-3 subunit delta
MKLAANQLSSHLKQQLAPVYLVSGDEPLLVQEAADHIRTAAQKKGYDECLRFTVDNSFDWSLFCEASVSDSLFSNQQMIVLRLTSTKFGDVGRKVLQTYLEKPSTEKILLLIADKLDAATQKTVWFKALDKVGVFLPIWPMQPAQLPGWISQRLQQQGLSADTQAVSLLADLTEGNLLSTAQMIERLSLLYPNTRITIEQVSEVGTDSARFNIFDLVDKILAGNALPILRVLNVLQEEGVEPILILWAITKEVRELAKMMQAMRSGQAMSQVLAAYRVWEKRKPLVSRTLNAHSAKTLDDALKMAAHIDLLIKGLAKGSVWDRLTDLALAGAGLRLPHVANG